MVSGVSAVRLVKLSQPLTCFLRPSSETDADVHRIVREIGALTAVLGGLDLLAFTAGVGEHNGFVRERVCRNLAFLSVRLDANAIDAPVISTTDSRVRVAVEPTNEKWIAARYTQELMTAALCS